MLPIKVKEFKEFLNLNHDPSMDCFLNRKKFHPADFYAHIMQGYMNIIPTPSTWHHPKNPENVVTFKPNLSRLFFIDRKTGKPLGEWPGNLTHLASTRLINKINRMSDDQARAYWVENTSINKLLLMLDEEAKK